MSYPVCDLCAHRSDCDSVDNRKSCKRYEPPKPNCSNEFLCNRIKEIETQLIRAQQSHHICYICRAIKLEERIVELENENKKLGEKLLECKKDPKLCPWCLKPPPITEKEMDARRDRVLSFSFGPIPPPSFFDKFLRKIFK
jgi:hypothetical protein